MILVSVLVSLLSCSSALAQDAAPPNVAPPPTATPEPIQKELSAKELTMSGVTIGKSNLYNAVGRFGTNMFKKEDGVYVICWKGDDGTILAFESGASGGRDQTITGARLIAPGVEYKYATDCKPSKKVSSKLELLGVTLGDSMGDVEKKRGAPSGREDSRMMWHYKSEAKKKSVKTDVEIASSEDKVNSISVDRVEVR
jgi:hypothetical protein